MSKGRFDLLNAAATESRIREQAVLGHLNNAFKEIGVR